MTRRLTATTVGIVGGGPAGLADARARDGGDVRFGVSETRVVDVTGDRPGVLFTDVDGVEREIRCDYLVGADGAHSICRLEIPAPERRHYFQEYPFAWLGIICRRALARVWRSQHFSYWLTRMLHALPGATEFDARRQLAELECVVGSDAGSTYLAEGYTGWPNPTRRRHTVEFEARPPPTLPSCGKLIT